MKKTWKNQEYYKSYVKKKKKGKTIENNCSIKQAEKVGSDKNSDSPLYREARIVKIFWIRKLLK